MDHADAETGLFAGGSGSLLLCVGGTLRSSARLNSCQHALVVDAGKLRGVAARARFERPLPVATLENADEPPIAALVGKDGESPRDLGVSSRIKLQVALGVCGAVAGARVETARDQDQGRLKSPYRRISVPVKRCQVFGRARALR